MAEEQKLQVYVRVRDRAGKEFICPRDALRNPNDLSEEELRNCFDSAGEAFTDSEAYAIIRSKFRKDVTE